jgi:hypothetical protein
MDLACAQYKEQRGGQAARNMAPRVRAVEERSGVARWGRRTVAGGQTSQIGEMW